MPVSRPSWHKLDFPTAAIGDDGEPRLTAKSSREAVRFGQRWLAMLAGGQNVTKSLKQASKRARELREESFKVVGRR